MTAHPLLLPSLNLSSYFLMAPFWLNKSSMLSEQSFRNRIMLGLGVSFLYILLFIPLYDLVNRVAIAFSVVPVIVIAVAFGVQGGFFAGVVSIPLNMALFVLAGENTIYAFLGRNFYATHIVFICIGIVVGYLNRIRTQLSRELNERTQMETKLVRAKDDWERTFDAVPDLIMLIDDQHRVIRANKAMADKFGVEQDEIIGKACHVLAHGTEEPPLFCPHTALLMDGQEHTVDVYEERLGGNFQVSVSPLHDADGQLLGSVHVARDISERVEAERRTDQLNRLQEDLLKPDSLDGKLKRITDGVVEIFDADFARIWIIKQGDRCGSGCIHAEVVEGPHVCHFRDRCLHLMASSGRYAHIDGQVHRRVPFGCYKIGRVAAGEDNKFITNNVIHDERVHDRVWAKELGLVSFAGYRLLSATGTPIGVLALFSHTAISPDQDALLEGLAGITAQVIQTARAEQALEQSNRELTLLYEATKAITSDLSQDVVLLTVAEQMTQALDTSGCALSLWNRELNQLEILVDYSAVRPDEVEPPGTIYKLSDYPASRTVLETRQANVINQDDPEADEAELAWMAEQGVQSLLMLPLAVRDRVLGLVEVYEESRVRDFTMEEIRLAENVVAQAAIAIENARLYDQVQQELTERVQAEKERERLLEKTQRHADEMTAVSGVLHALNSSVDVSDSFSVVAAALRVNTLCDRVSLALLEEPGREWATFVAIDEPNPELGLGTRIKLSDTAAAENILAGRIHLTPDLGAETNFSGERVLYKSGLRSRINLPLRIGEQVIGALNMSWLRESGYEEAQLPLLKQVASAVALAVEKSNLFQEVQEMAITDVLTGLHNRRHLFDLGFREVERLRRYGGSLAAIMLDIDHFKRVNDTHGHRVGDKVLQALAVCLKRNTRDIDIVGRYGGEEFVILMPETDQSDAFLAATRLKNQVEYEEVPYPGGTVSITISIGVAVGTQDLPNLDDLLENADTALYAAKQAGRNCVMTAWGKKSL